MNNNAVSSKHLLKIPCLRPKNYRSEGKKSSALIFIIQGYSFFFHNYRGHDTVGAVALDSLGNVACATSTGGIRNKMVGRVGDSPIIGESDQR